MNCILTNQLRAKETTNVFKCFPANPEVFLPEMILISVHNELFKPKLCSWINPHGFVKAAMVVVFILVSTGLPYSVKFSFA